MHGFLSPRCRTLRGLSRTTPRCSCGDNDASLRTFLHPLRHRGQLGIRGLGNNASPGPEPQTLGRRAPHWPLLLLYGNLLLLCEVGVIMDGIFIAEHGFLVDGLCSHSLEIGNSPGPRIRTLN